LLATEIKGDLLVLFRKNPGIVDTVEAVARRVGRTPDSIRVDLNDLVDLGILRTRRIGEYNVISLDHARDVEIQGIVEKYLKELR